MAAEILNVTDDSFKKEVLEHEGVVLVDFWAEWCGPCRNMMKVIKEFAEETKGKVKVALINVDENQKVPTDMNVRGIPTMALFSNGKEVSVKVGGMTLPTLKDWVASNVTILDE